MNGGAENGRYYLKNRREVTEVSRGVYVYSLIHTVSVWVTHGLALGGGLLLAFCGQMVDPPSNPATAASPDAEKAPQEVGSANAVDNLLRQRKDLENAKRTQA